MVEVIGNLVRHLLTQDGQEVARVQISGFFDILQERLRDVSSYVRSKVLQVLLVLAV